MTGHDMSRQYVHSEGRLTDLSESLLISILRHLPLETKCQAQGVCRTFRAILRKPSERSFVWETINLSDPLFRAASPPALAWWLIRRMHGIRSLQYAPAEPDQRVVATQDFATPELRRVHQIVIQVFPQLAALLSPEADIRLDLGFAIAEVLFGRLQWGCGRAQDYWASLASSLTVLSIKYNSLINYSHTTALNQLVRLQLLTLEGYGGPRLRFASDANSIELSLPMLRILKIAHLERVTISLRCPRLQSLELGYLQPLLSLEGAPPLTRMALESLEEGPSSLSLKDIFPGQRLELITKLKLMMGPAVYADPAALDIIQQMFGNGRLTELIANCPVETQEGLGPVYTLPNSLQTLILHLPLERGLPVVLERLTNLRTFLAINTGFQPMHLDRPLDPFLEMPHLTILAFSGRTYTHMPRRLQTEGLSGYTPRAMRLLGAAMRRIIEGNLEPSGRKLVLRYANHTAAASIQVAGQ